jgi:hypothetical protein
MAKRTIRRRMRKSKTIRKVMIGCNGRRGRRGRSRAKVGGAAAGKIEAAQYAGASPEANQNLAGGTAAFLEAQQAAGNSPPAAPVTRESNMTQLPQQGGARTRRHHRRRLRYKKSMARKSRRA